MGEVNGTVSGRKGTTLTQFSGYPSDKSTVKMTTLNRREVVASEKAMEFKFTAYWINA
jgi:hypothetical protein